MDLTHAFRNLTVAAIAVSAAACAATIQPAVPPPEALPAPVETTASTLVTGRIASFTAGPRGLLDGVVLDDGTHIHFRPHAGAKLVPLLQRGDTIRVSGWEANGARGRTVEAAVITNMNNGKSIDVAALPDPVPPHPPGLPPGAITPPEPVQQ